MIVKNRRQALLDGDVHYYTGVPCNRGHLGPRYSSTGNCIECHRPTSTMNKGVPTHVTAAIKVARDKELAPIRTQIETFRNVISNLEYEERQINAKYQLQTAEAEATYLAQASVESEKYRQDSESRATQMQTLKRFTDFRVPLLTEVAIDRMLDTVIEYAARRGVELTRDQAYIKSDNTFSYYRCHPEDKLALVGIGNAMYQPAITPQPFTIVPQIAGLQQVIAEIEASEDTTPQENNL